MLTFKVGPDFETKADAGNDGTYDVVVRVSDGALTDTQSLAITVTDVDEAPVITSNGGGPTAAITAAENQIAVTTVTSTDVDAGATKTFSISGGADASFFDIDSATGVLTFKSAPDFETKVDAGNDGVYDVVVQVSDGSLTDTQALAVSVTESNDAPIITSAATASIPENSASVLTIAAVDADSGATLTFSIAGGSDASLFTIDSLTGALSFIGAPNYESAADSGADNIYNVQVGVSDGLVTTTQDIAITVTNVNEVPAISVPGPLTTTEDSPRLFSTALGSAITIADPDGGAGQVELTITANHGIVSLGRLSGLTFSVGDGAEDDVMTFRGTIADINAALDGLTYAPDSNFHGVGGFDLAVNDLGNSGSGGPLSATAQQEITVTAVNDSPSGQPTLIGGATEDQTLTANTATISDADGLGAFSYQWLRDGVAINGQTSATYLLGDADVGKAISVTVSYTDGDGANEAITSAATTSVQNVNDLPSGVAAIIGTTTENDVLIADVSSIGDADGIGTFSYQWFRDGVGIAGATSSTLTLGDDDVGRAISYTVSFTDQQGTSETLTSTATGLIVNVNDAPYGTPSILGQAIEGSTLSVSTSGISDADGLGAMTYQWLRSGSPITGATSANYTLSANDIGASITVEVVYTDARGAFETIVSAPTGAVVALPVLIPILTAMPEPEAPGEKSVSPSETPLPPLERTNAPSDEETTGSDSREQVNEVPTTDTAHQGNVGDVPVAISQPQDRELLGFDNNYVLNLSLDGLYMHAGAVLINNSDSAASPDSDRGLVQNSILLNEANDTTDDLVDREKPNNLEFDISRGAIGISSSVVALSAAWALRAATLAGSVFGALPLWARIDVLPLAMRRRSLGEEPLSKADLVFETEDGRKQ